MQSQIKKNMRKNLSKLFTFSVAYINNVMIIISL